MKAKCILKDYLFSKNVSFTRF